MTPSEVLAVLAGIRQEEIKYDEASPAVSIRFETTVGDWLHSQSEHAIWPHHEGVWLNKVFDTDFGSDQWRIVLRPHHKRTLHDVCELIATQARVPDVRPVVLLGKPCMPAATFFVIRGLLARTGADVSGLAPSTPLSDFADRGLPEIHSQLFRAWPDLIPEMETIYRRDGLHMLAGGVLLIATTVVGVIGFAGELLAMPFAIACLAAFIAVWRNSEARTSRPKTVKWSRFRTFRDLCIVIADSKRRIRALEYDLAP